MGEVVDILAKGRVDKTGFPLLRNKIGNIYSCLTHKGSVPEYWTNLVNLTAIFLNLLKERVAIKPEEVNKWETAVRSLAIYLGGENLYITAYTQQQALYDEVGIEPAQVQNLLLVLFGLSEGSVFITPKGDEPMNPQHSILNIETEDLLLRLPLHSQQSPDGHGGIFESVSFCVTDIKTRKTIFYFGDVNFNTNYVSVLPTGCFTEKRTDLIGGPTFQSMSESQGWNFTAFQFTNLM